MHAGSAPVIRLEGPFALGHGVLLVLSDVLSGASPAPHASQASWSAGRSEWYYYWPARSPTNIDVGRSRIADFRATD